MSAERLLKFAEVSQRVGLGRSAIYSRIAKGHFPAPIKVGAASRWPLSEIEAWLALAVETRVVRYRPYRPPKRPKSLDG